MIADRHCHDQRGGVGMCDRHQNLGDAKHPRPALGVAVHPDRWLSAPRYLDLFPTYSTPSGSHRFHDRLLPGEASSKSPGRCGESEGVLPLVLGEAALGETWVSVQNPLDPSDIGKIHSQTEDAHRHRLQTGDRPPWSLSSARPIRGTGLKQR